MPASPHPLLPCLFGDFLSAGSHAAYFTGGQLVVQGSDPSLLPVRWEDVPTYGGGLGMPPEDDDEAWERIERTLYCGRGVFDLIVGDLKNAEAARRRVAYEAELTRARAAAAGAGEVTPIDGNEPGRASKRISTAQAAAALGIATATLADMEARAPRGLPSAPDRVGNGPKRRHLRWDPAGLHAWVAAYDAWRTTEGAGRKPTTTATRKERSTRGATTERRQGESLLAYVKRKPAG